MVWWWLKELVWKGGSVLCVGIAEKCELLILARFPIVKENTFGCRAALESEIHSFVRKNLSTC